MTLVAKQIIIKEIYISIIGFLIVLFRKKGRQGLS